MVVFVLVNIGFFVFNMIPWPPLDGSRLLYAFAPEMVQRIMKQIESLGMIGIVYLVAHGFIIGFYRGFKHITFEIPEIPQSYLVGNLRVKTPTGRGPFDVNRDANGLETELATGSGFWGIEPSVTAIYPSDPVVFFGNVGYLWNLGRDVNERIGDTVIEHVNPGDSIRMSVGMGVSLNERTSASAGYQHDYVFKTKTDFRGGDGARLAAESDSLQIGSAFLGASYRLSDRVGVNATFQIGATSDAPDMQATLRIPISFDLAGPQRGF
jgi:hypothetical protein